MRKSIIVRKSPSSSARLLAEALGLVRVSPNSQAVQRNRPFILNWGCSAMGPWPFKVKVLNLPAAVASAIDKRKCADILEGASIRTVNFCAGPYSNVRSKYPDDILLARYTLTGNSGAGIKVIRPGDNAPDKEPVAYSVYVKKQTEYRVHVAFGRAIHVVEKRKRVNAEPSQDDKLIRSVGDTWVFCEENLACDSNGTRADLEATAIAAVTALGLHFGAVDVLYSKAGEYVVCEINTKPGIGSTSTLNAYTTVFKEMFS